MKSNGAKKYKYLRINEKIIDKKLSEMPLKKLSKQSGFCRRKPKKITPKQMLEGFFLMVSDSGSNSFKNWAMKIGMLSGEMISKQGLWKRMNESLVEFLRKVLNSAISKSLTESSEMKFSNRLKDFTDIIVEDSTSIRLNDTLSEEYPGNRYWDRSKKKPGTSSKSILKIQSTYSVKRKGFIRFSISSFRNNDQSYSKEILEVVSKGALLLRDLGYFSAKVFRELNENGVFFISRLRNKVNLLSTEEEPIDLAKMLRKRGVLDQEICLGQLEKMPVRLVAVPVEDSIAAERRRKAKNKRDNRTHLSKKQLYLLGWEIFVTNVPQEKLPTNDIWKAYAIRWRIEIIFKSWKSYFRITNIQKDKNPIRVKTFIYAMLIFIVLFQVIFYDYCINRILKKYKTAHNQTGISLMQYTQFIMANASSIIMGTCNMSFMEKQISYYCKYDSRNDRTNFHQYLINLS